MCQVCEFTIFRLRRDLELARSRLERDKFETLSSILTDIELVRWATKEVQVGGMRPEDLDNLISGLDQVK